MANCFHCKKELGSGHRPSRGESCPKCGSDVKVCLNCRFYDSGAYNQCREPSAERVVEKERANFCEFFELSSAPQKAPGEDPLASLKDLFKK